MNVYDSERVAVMLVENGWEYTENAEEADLIIINSCSVREKPLLKLYSCAGRYLPQKKSKGTLIFIMGCVAQQLGGGIRTPLSCKLRNILSCFRFPGRHA